MLERTAAGLTNCDIEPIHIPGSIQPYGTMLIADAHGVICGYAGSAGDIADIMGKRLTETVASATEAAIRDLPETGIKVLAQAQWAGATHDVIAYRSGNHTIVELTVADSGPHLDATFLAHLDGMGAALERSTSLSDLAEQAARVFQELTGYSRVMVYRFIEDDAGVVIGESLSNAAAGFMNHHFPASDIPKQARALYVRNRVRVIADVNYTPLPVVSGRDDLTSIDMSDSTLRSVSPVHIQYLKNMGVAASASMSIVKDGILWGLVACHHDEPRPLSLTTRLACQTIATALARQIRMREDGDLYRERIRLRGQEDVIVSRLGSDESLSNFLDRSGADLASLLRADGFAAMQGADLFCAGSCPDPIDVRALGEHVRKPASIKPVVTSHLSREFPAATAYRDLASGLLAVTMSTEVPTILMWFRAEQLQTVKWAGNPHKDVELEEGAVLMPRASFEAWSEHVSGRSKEWTHAESESASRVVKLMLEARNNRRMRKLNRELTTTLKENESLIQQKDFLLKEVNHRVQNSLSLVSAFLRMQARTADAAVKEQLAEAEHRLMAVGLVHRRLYQDDSLEIIDLSRYLEELVGELQTTMDPAWNQHLNLDLSPMLIETERAVSVGLIVNELLTNAAKYAYEGKPGPLTISVEQHRETFRLIVADRGKGHKGEVEGTGFGSRMLAALVDRLGGTIDQEDNKPGYRTIVAAPIKMAETGGK
ncbi:GAF domain-containing protein [Aliihoeflea aestuarii]|uniref:histidine kinase dimerization/phosphoacceptor domain -containing protein n=1 Tax=Aliihoeflea aestuarii TaxID=453840 RepID=UPI0020929BB7|nr:histidine kinase dimerization/phosphoacceptor domain -containing protein [Aliihoeflea aestuarii]MCO6389639.1 GAF domain-containing protein [Aliihoeflea aestuarii]